MQTTQVKPGTCIEYTIDGAVITVGGLDIDAAAEQKDERVIVDVFKNGSITRSPGGYRIMAIEIPPITYTDDVADPLDVNNVVITLWPITGGTQ